VQVSVNVSARQFIDGDLCDDVAHSLETSGLAPELLELELTETSLIANTERTIASLVALKALGVQTCVDDFGTGYSSLAYLRRFPIDRLKIDRAFIRDVTSHPEDATIVLAIIRMAHVLDIDVVAEGVETAAQLEYLRRHGCDHIQGYYFCAALPPLELEAWLGTDPHLPVPEGARAERTTALLVVNDNPAVLAAVEAMLGADGFLERVQDLDPATLRIVLSGRADSAAFLDTVNLAPRHHPRQAVTRT
jgi:hypothetical protein